MENNEKYAEATIIQSAKKLGIDIGEFDMNELIMGMAVEMEHGSISADTNVTDDNPVEILKITIAHLRELPDYYTRLEKIEGETKEGLQDKDFEVISEKTLKMMNESKRYKELCGITENEEKIHLTNQCFTDNIVKENKLNEKQILNEEMKMEDFDVVKFSTSKPKKNEEDEVLYKMDSPEE